MVITPNLALHTWDLTTDRVVLFKDFRNELAGTVDSNMTKLDALAQNLIIGTDDELGVPIPVDSDTLNGNDSSYFAKQTDMDIVESDILLKASQDNLDTTNTNVTNLGTNKVDKTQIKNTLTETVVGNVLDATQGTALKGLVGELKSLKVNKAQEPWITSVLQNGWVNHVFNNTASYYKDELNVVHIKGIISSGTVTAGTILFTLPVGYRPSVILIIPVFSFGSSVLTPVTLEILTNGTVSLGVPATNTYLCLDNISFRI